MERRHRVFLVFILAIVIILVGTITVCADPTVWTEFGVNYTAPSGSAYYPSVLYDAGGFGSGSPLYKMWYTDGSNGYVVSASDGLAWGAPTSLTGLGADVHHVQVLYDAACFGATTCDSSATHYRIWYWDTDADLYSINAIAAAESADGVSWSNDQALTQDGTWVLVTGAGSGWNRGTYGPISLFYQSGAPDTGTEPWDYKYVMYYDGTDGGSEYTGLAYSTDGLHWTAYTGNPVLQGDTSAAWDCSDDAFGTVMKDGSAYRFWYSGGGGDNGSGGCLQTDVSKGIGYASSSGGKAWTKDAGNPIFHVSDGVAYRNSRTYTPSVIVDRTGLWRMYFTVVQDTGNKKIAMALMTPSDVYVDDGWVGQSQGAIVYFPGDPNPHQFGFDAFATVQNGINAVLNGGTVHVAAGNYPEPVNIENRHDLSIIGADHTSIVKPSTTLPWDVGGYGSSRQAAVRVVSSTHILFNKLIFDFDLVKGNNVIGVLYWDSTGQVDNNVLQNMSLPDTSAYYEITSYVRAPSYTDAARAPVSFTNNTFIDTGRLGIVSHGYVQMTINFNTFYKTIHDFGYAMEIGSESTATISDNKIYGYDTPAASDGSQSAGIYIENAFTGGSPHITKNVTLSGNEIYDCQYALYIGNEFDGYAGDVDIQFSSVGNNYHDNIEGGVVLVDEDRSAGSSVRADFQNDTFTNNGDVGAFVYTRGDGEVHAGFIGVTISGHDEGIFLADYATGPSGSDYDVQVRYSNLGGNTSYAVHNTYAGTGIAANTNWWGDASGPSGVGGGSGGAVSANVDYSPWLGFLPGTSPMTYYADTTSNAGDLNPLIDTMSAGDSLVLKAGPYAGGFTLDKDGIILKGEAGAVIRPGSHGAIVSADEITIDGLTFDGTGYSGGDCGIYVNDGVQRLWVRNCEIRNWPDDGMHFAGAVTDLKLIDNYVHDNAGDGIDFAATPGGQVYMYGNAFRTNGGGGGGGIRNNGGTEVTAEYNEWGDVAGPTGTNGDGVVGSVDYAPWVFAKHWVDAPPEVRELETITVYARMDVHHLYGTSFTLTFPKDKLQLTAEPVIGAFKTVYSYGSLTTMAAANASGEIQLVHNRMDPDGEYDATNDILLTLQFQAQEIAGVSTTAEITYKDGDVDNGAKDGVRIFLDSATGDTITIYGTTTVQGVVDLQGRDNDSGAVVDPLAGVAHGYNPAPVTTGSWGTYSFSNMTDDSYTFTIEMPRYLDASASVVVSGDTKTLNKVILLGGDCNDNDEVEITDASTIGHDFGHSGAGIDNPTADINNDNMVDILDLVLMGGNYGKTSSPWAL